MSTRGWKLLLLIPVLTILSFGGCELSCRSNHDNPVEDAIDEVGDEVEDVVREIKK